MLGPHGLMVMPGVLRKPGWPSRACDEAGPECSHSLSRSFSAGEEKQETGEWRKQEDKEKEDGEKRSEERERKEKMTSEELKRTMRTKRQAGACLTPVRVDPSIFSAKIEEGIGRIGR